MVGTGDGQKCPML